MLACYGDALHFQPLHNPAQSILVVLHDLPLGGTERIAVRLANRWAQGGRNVTILCGSRQGELGWLVDDAVKVLECDPPIPRGPGSRRRLARAVADYLTQRPHDILFVPGNYHWPVMPAVALLPDRLRPVIVAQVSTPLFRHGRGPLRQIVYNWRTRRHFPGADAAVSLSPAMTEDVDRVLARRITRCIRLPALDEQSHARPRTRAGGKLIVAAGRLVGEKGFDVALRAFAGIEDPEARLAILGEGPARAGLEALAADLGVAARVAFPGYVPDIRPWLDAARVFLLSSYYEGYAAVVVEALDAGRPVVSTDCTPAAFELLSQPGAGAVSPIGDACALAEGLRQVMAAPAPDPEQLAATVAGYRIGPISAAYLDLFDVVRARRGPPERPSRPRPITLPAFAGVGGRRLVAAFGMPARASDTP